MRCIFEDVRKVGNLHVSSITLLVTRRETLLFLYPGHPTLCPKKTTKNQFLVKRRALITALRHSSTLGEVEGGIRSRIYDICPRIESDALALILACNEPCMPRPRVVSKKRPYRQDVKEQKKITNIVLCKVLPSPSG